MSRHCSVCAHRDRNDIDHELAQHQCNVSELARRTGLGRDALNRHRDAHVTSYLRIYGNAADLPTLGELHGELLRLHSAALDNLAAAERGRLVWEIAEDEDGRELRDSAGKVQRVRVRKFDPSAVSRAIAEARKVVDRISMLAADASTYEERPAGVVAGELGSRIAEQLEKLAQRRELSGDPHTPRDVERGSESMRGVQSVELLDVRTDVRAVHPSRGAVGGASGQTGVPSPPQVSLDAATPSEIQSLSPKTRAALAASEATEPATTSKRADQQVILSIPNPNWDGSPAASPDERASAGFPDIELTLADLKARPDLVAQLAPRSSHSEQAG